MTCRDFVEFLADYESGDLSADERSRFEAHLGECAECVAYLGTYRATIALEKSACGDPDDTVPSDVPEGLVRAILAARGKGR